MKINIFGKNIEVTDGIKSAVQEKLGKLDKYFAEETRADVTLSVNRNDQKVEVTIPVKGNIIRSEQVSFLLPLRISAFSSYSVKSLQFFGCAWIAR